MTSYPMDPKRAARAAGRPTRVGRWETSRRRLQVKAFARLSALAQNPRRAQFEALLPAPGRIVFLGDSITEAGFWDEWFPGIGAINRGIGGEKTDEVLARLNTAINAPNAVFLLVGTNDISASVPTADIVSNVTRIVQGIEHRAPGTPVVVQSIMPRGATYREEVLFVNGLLKKIVADAPAHVTYLDLWPALATPEGTLRPELTKDNLHLLPAAYRVWVDVLRPEIERLS